MTYLTLKITEIPEISNQDGLSNDIKSMTVSHLIEYLYKNFGYFIEIDLRSDGFRCMVHNGKHYKMLGDFKNQRELYVAALSYIISDQ